MSFLPQLFCSGARAGLIRVLFGLESAELHLRELQRRIGLSVATVRQDVRKMVEMGLVSARRDGNRLYFKAIDSHPLTPVLRQLVLRTDGLAGVLAKAVNSENIEMAFIFGSLATGEAKADSDIDLCIIGRIGLRKAIEALSSVTNELSREINPHIFTRVEFANRVARKEHFAMSLLQTPRLFIKGDNDEFIAMAGK